jgi:hypothetical protein
VKGLGASAGVEEELMQQRCNVIGEEELRSGGRRRTGREEQLGVEEVRQEVNPVAGGVRVHACSQKARFWPRARSDGRAQCSWVAAQCSAVQCSAAQSSEQCSRREVLLRAAASCFGFGADRAGGRNA